MFDIRVAHSYAKSNCTKEIEALLEENEKEKVKSYCDRVLQIEKASFVPLVFTTNGGMGKQCVKLHQQLARLLSEKKGDIYSAVMAHMRARLRFAILRTTLVAIRGYRGHSKANTELTN